MKPEYVLRPLALAAVLIAGSCSVGSNGPVVWEDGARNHPIAVEPSYRDLKIYYTGSADGMNADDTVKFDAFVADYRAHGNGSLGISVPSGSASRAAITYFGERAAATGISRDKIMISTREAGSDMRVDVSYIAYTARSQACGDWSENEAFTIDNTTPKNFGCSTQHNLAAMVADPRDLLGPGAMGPVDTNRRAVVMDHYQKGETTQAIKHMSDAANEQGSNASSVGGQ
jgi:pilus assembly protein CpaD